MKILIDTFHIQRTTLKGIRSESACLKSIIDNFIPLVAEHQIFLDGVSFEGKIKGIIEANNTFIYYANQSKPDLLLMMRFGCSSTNKSGIFIERNQEEIKTLCTDLNVGFNNAGYRTHKTEQVKQFTHFTSCHTLNIPAIYLNCGYLDSVEDIKLFSGKVTANIIFEAIKDNFKIEKIKNN